MKSQPFGPLDPANYRESVRRALAEDFGWGDVTTDATVPAEARGRGTFLAKAPCVVAGLDTPYSFPPLDGVPLYAMMAYR